MACTPGKGGTWPVLLGEHMACTPGGGAHGLSSWGAGWGEHMACPPGEWRAHGLYSQLLLALFLSTLFKG